ncbi:hypothetical protein H6S82_00465 [Planktothrix sp. FACHB-1355]|uniref:type IV toxin-antitoxin system AbiEi family antitoxin n=1 Tax=Planktothrix sp. FACHB-1355 TaxID=2692854 RepID=UPI00168BB893|nr:type IV toxin-antitoxin system AbiEi family antitoxin [Planktothrix sp. FACHB-1355]MBD3557342.1 hypothetical protein [Planktothrix sp. FACHB-1355]
MPVLLSNGWVYLVIDMQNDEIFQAVQEILKTTTGVELKRLRQKEAFGKSEGLAVSLEYPHKLPDGAENAFLKAEVKENLTPASINNLFQKSKESPGKIVLITRQVTPQQADRLRELNIPFGDTAGNAFFNEPGLYVFVAGKKTLMVREKPSRAFDKAGLKIVFALLTEPDLLQKDMRTIADRARVGSISTVSDIFKDLEKQHFLYQPGKSGTRKRKLNKKRELLGRWVEGYIERLRPSLNPVRFISRKFEGRWWDDVEIKDYNAVWGGEKGGELLTNHLRPATVAIYADSLLPRLQAKYGLVRSKQGNIEILEKFWTGGAESGDEAVAPPLVVYADLIATGDERNLETAQMIYERYLAELTKGAA